ncbi:hypothetical protein B0T18DRAFT_316068 [Schizothecium vesticola]|uniref:YCII-related domain-containing protein n=1 Tax=Schizothecium vesticola TaxID=314040 RepID=A0AA40KDK4_9PEZI|nr:hypothetical protein B0T18DRAFT_316068 [Schizothecium vesticola]
MATTAETTPRKYEWLVVIPDFPGMLEKRREIRPHHFAGLKPAMESGLYSMGGAVLNSVPKDDDPASLDMCGSTVVMVAASKEEVYETLKKDVYATSGVWNVMDAQMWPLKCAFRIPVKQ